VPRTYAEHRTENAEHIVNSAIETPLPGKCNHSGFSFDAFLVEITLLKSIKIACSVRFLLDNPVIIRQSKYMKDLPDPRQFATTHWSLVGAARPDEVSQTRAREALEELCRAYWYPLYAFVRSRGYSAVDAQDLTQAFFVKFLEMDGFASADRQRGRFRSYLLGAVKHFLSNEWHKIQTQKRGGDVKFIEFNSIDPEAQYVGTMEQSDNPERLFDREWALQTVAGALKTLRDEMTKAGKREQFDALKGTLTGQDELPRDQIAAKLNMSEGAVKVAVHRLRQRYRNLLRSAIAETVSDEADLEDEMRYLIEVLRQP
jgi:RNA polymerase sigma factor (sigma-70 family)